MAGDRGRPPQGAAPPPPAAGHLAPTFPPDTLTTRPAAPDAPLASAGEVIGTIIHLPVDAALFVGKAGVMVTKLLLFQLTHPFDFSVPRVILWAQGGAEGEPPTDDPDMLELLIRTQNADFADRMAAHCALGEAQAKEAVKVMRWAIATQGRGVPPTHDALLLARLIGTQDQAFAQLMQDFLVRFPKAAPDVAAVERWAIETRGKGLPPTQNPHLLAVLIGTQEPAFATLMQAFLAKHPKAGADVAKVERWAIETRGQGVPPTNHAALLVTLIGTQEPKFAKLLGDHLAKVPASAPDVAAVARWAIETRGQGVPPTHDPALLAALIGTQEPKFAKLMQDFLAAHPEAGKDVAAVERWAIETRGQGVPPTKHAALLVTLIGTQEPKFAKLLGDHLAKYPAAGPDVAAVAHWAIETRGQGVPPTQDPALLAALIGTQEPKFAALMRDFLAAHPEAGADVAAVERWAIETRGKGVPPTQHAALLVTLIGTQEPAFAKLLGDQLAKHPTSGPDVAAVARWAIETRGKGLPPTQDPTLLAALIGTQEPKFATLMQAFLAAHPEAGKDVAAVERWAIETRGQGVPPTQDPRLLASLIASRAPELGARLEAFVAKHPNRARETAAVSHWLIATAAAGGRPSGFPPTHDPGLLAIVARAGFEAWRQGEHR